MRVFVTGASGFIGSAVVRELIDAGHQVLGLARSPESAQAVSAAGAEVVKGSLDDLDSLRRGAAQSDGVIHTAFIHDFSDWAKNCEIDRVAIEVLGSALAGTGRTLIVSSGTALLAPGRLSTEDDVRGPDAPPLPRVSEETALAMAKKGVRALAVRLPPSVHGKGDHGFVPQLIKVAREKGVSGYIGDGANRWPAVHRLDAARAFRLALENEAAGPYIHAIQDEGVPAKEIAEVIGKHLNIPVVSISPDDVSAHFGWIGFFFSIDCPASSAKTRETLGWTPTEVGLIEDLDEGHYFG